MHAGLTQSSESSEPSLSGQIDAHASIPARIAARAAAEPDHWAICDSSCQLSFLQLESRSNQLAAHLISAGVESEMCVGIFTERGADFVVSALAIMKAGGAYLPLDPSTPAERAAFILSDAAAPILLTHRQKTQSWPVGPWRVIEIDGVENQEIRSKPTKRMESDPAGDSLAYVIYTSGSTRRPKGVEITHANLLNLIDWHQRAFGVTSADRASQVAGLGFDAAGWEIWPALTTGASLHFADDITRRSAAALREWIVAQKITISFVPTVLAEQLLHTSWPDETALRTFLTGADTLHRRPIAGLPFVVVNNYGPTECTVVSTSGIVTPNEDIDSPPSIGKSIDNATALILNDAIQPVPRGEAGELCLAGALVGRGYRNNPAMTASRFVNYSPEMGPSMRIYCTGDRARILENGEIAFLGRLDDQVKIRGYRIELGEIVTCLDRYPGVEACAVVLRDGGDGLSAQSAAPEGFPSGPQLVAYIVAAGDANLIAADLREYLNTRLPDYMIPSHFVKIADLPMTAHGKLDKAALPAPSADNLLPNRIAAPFAAPNEPTEPGAPVVGLEQSQISAMVASLLGQPTVDSDENFFMIGGHSMLGVQLVAQIRDRFGVKLTLLQLFSAPTVAALSAEVARLKAATR